MNTYFFKLAVIALIAAVFPLHVEREWRDRMPRAVIDRVCSATYFFPYIPPVFCKLNRLLFFTRAVDYPHSGRLSHKLPERARTVPPVQPPDETGNERACDSGFGQVSRIGKRLRLAVETYICFCEKIANPQTGFFR